MNSELFKTFGELCDSTVRSVNFKVPYHKELDLKKAEIKECGKIVKTIGIKDRKINRLGLKVLETLAEVAAETLDPP